jgi:hypothetical protein
MRILRTDRKLRSFAISSYALGKKLGLISLICCIGLGSCRSTVMPCPKISSSQKKEGLFSNSSNGLKYDRKGRIKK